MLVKRIASLGALLGIMVSLSSCAVGPDFVVPAPPDVGRYAKERLATRTSSADSHNGRAEHFVNGRDVSAEWWQLFRSPALNSLIRKSLAANPNLQSTMAALRVAKENVYAAQGAYFPTIDGNFNPTRQQLAGPISPTLNNGATVFNLYTGQVLVSYTFDAWVLNRRTVEGLQGTADFQSFQAEAAYLTLISNVVVAAIQEASLRAQIEATERLIAANERMLGIVRQKFDAGAVNRADLAVQELKANREFERAAKTSLDVTMEQFNAGQIEVLLLLVAQVTYQQAVLALVQAEAARLSDAAALCQALGGGWWNRDGPPSPEQKRRRDRATDAVDGEHGRGKWSCGGVQMARHGVRVGDA
jgi:outer membrane protein TolC